MKLLTDALRKQFPPLYATENLPLLEARAMTCFYMPFGSWYWYPTEFDGKDTFFGLVIGFEPEFGYFTLSELEGASDPAGNPAVLRKVGFQSATLREILKTTHPSILPQFE